MNRLPHWSGHHDEGQAYGPFTFLNPTTRRLPLPFQKPVRESSQEDLQVKENGARNATPHSNGKNDDIRAEDVERLYRTRDNRKGRFPLTLCTIGSGG
jgi:hypothetical protein